MKNRLNSLLTVACAGAALLLPCMALQADSTPQPVGFTLSSFPFTRPPAWIWVTPSSALRQVQLTIPAATNASENADVSFFYFGTGQGGSVQANVDRWAKQFSSADGSPVKAVTETRTVASTPVVFVSARGSFATGMTDNTAQLKSDFALRGAILESIRGDVFVKMTGPEKLVKEATATFDAMIAKACQEKEPK